MKKNWGYLFSKQAAIWREIAGEFRQPPALIEHTEVSCNMLVSTVLYCIVRNRVSIMRRIVRNRVSIMRRIVSRVRTM